MDSSGSDLNIPSLAARISVELPQRLEYASFYNELQKVATSEDVTLEDFPTSLLNQLTRRGLDTKLRNMVYYWLKEKCSSFKYFPLEPLDYMKKCQESWESRVWKSVVSMSHHLGIPLARGRLSSEQESVEENWSEFSQWEIDLSRCKPVYSPKDFLDCILQIVSPNYQLNGAEKLWSSLASIPIKVKSLRELKCLFGDLTTGDPHFGLNRCNEGELDPTGSYSRNGAPKLIYAQRVRLAETIINRGLAPVAQEFLKKGCPPSLRSKIWQLILGSYVTHEHMEYYSELKQAVIKSDLIIDRLILKDVQLTAANDDQYFVFEDSLYQVLLCFTRDVTLLDLFDRSSKNPLTAQVKGKGKHVDTSVIYPPNGIVPFHGFTMYVAPLCYLYDDAETLFFTFRSLYTRYWYRLHEISSHEDGIIGLSILFEKLLHRHETQLWFHLRSLRVLPISGVEEFAGKGFKSIVSTGKAMDSMFAKRCIIHPSEQIFLEGIHTHMETSNEWYSDGTFKVALLLFDQLYTIHVARFNKVIPMVFALLPNRLESTYVKMLTALKELAPNLKPLSITTDFERAAKNAFKAVFPDTAKHGCLFHFGQCLWRRIQTLPEVSRNYVSDPDFALKIKCLTALAFVPPPGVKEALEVLISDPFYSSSKDIEDLVDYTEDNWIGGNRRGKERPPRFIFLGMQKLRVVFKWLMKGFSGYLPAEQVLQLWDLLLAYNTIQILPLFAMGVLSIRKENLMKAQLPQTVDAVLADLSSIRVLPVLQLALSKETF